MALFNPDLTGEGEREERRSALGAGRSGSAPIFSLGSAHTFHTISTPRRRHTADPASTRPYGPAGRGGSPRCRVGRWRRRTSRSNVCCPRRPSATATPAHRRAEHAVADFVRDPRRQPPNRCCHLLVQGKRPMSHRLVRFEFVDRAIGRRTILSGGAAALRPHAGDKKGFLCALQGPVPSISSPEHYHSSRERVSMAPRSSQYDDSCWSRRGPINRMATTRASWPPLRPVHKTRVAGCKQGVGPIADQVGAVVCQFDLDLGIGAHLRCGVLHHGVERS